MLYIRNILSPRSRATQEAQVDSLLERVGVTGKGELKDQRGGTLVESYSQSKVPDKFMMVFLTRLEQLQTAQEMAKLMALLYRAVCSTKYSGSLLEQLGNIHIAADLKLRKSSQSWFQPFYKAYLTYLMKLPSVSEVYLRAQDQGDIGCDSKTLLVDLFRLVNQINLILVPLNVTFNTVGRYYKDKKRSFKALYGVFKDEIMMLYGYMVKIVESLFKSFYDIEAGQLRMFLDVIPELEILADRIDEFLLNKYFDWEKPKRDLYFKLEEIAKIQYNLLGRSQ